MQAKNAVNPTIGQFENLERLIAVQVKEIQADIKDAHDIAEKFIARCLRMKDGNVEKAINLINAFHSSIKNFQNWSAAMQPSLYTDVYNSGLVVPLKYRDSNGSVIVVVRPAKWYPEKATFDQVIAYFWMISQYAHAESVDVQRNGFVTIWDFKDFSLQKALAANPLRLLDLLKMIQNGVAGRMKAYHGINHSKIIDVIYSTIKPFLKEKLTKRITFHKNQKSLLKHVNPDILPTDLGGTIDPQDCIDKQLFKSFLQSDKFFRGMIENGFPNK